MEDNNKDNNFLVFLAIAIILFIDNVDINALNVALPIIALDIGSDISSSQWIINIYFIFSAAFFIPAGYIGDRFGLRNTLCLGVFLILLSSLFCGIADSTAFMLISRAIQGVGYAFTFSMMLLITTRLLSEKNRNIGIGIFMAVATASAMIGPILGSVITTYIGWQAIFFLNVILCVPCLIILLNKLENYNANKPYEVNGLIGNLLLVIGILCAVFFAVNLSLTNDNKLKFSLFNIDSAWFFLFLACICFSTFTFLNKRLGNPIVSLGVLSNYKFVNVNIFRSLLQLTSFSLFFWMPTFFQMGLGFSLIESGFIVTVMTFSAALFSLASGFLINKIGRHRTSVMSHLFLIAGLSSLLFNHPGYGFYHLSVAVFIIGSGLSMLYTIANSDFVESITENYDGMFSGVYYTVSYISGALGVFLVGIIINIYGIEFIGESFPSSAQMTTRYLNATQVIVSSWVLLSIISLVFVSYTFRKLDQKNEGCKILLSNE